MEIEDKTSIFNLYRFIVGQIYITTVTHLLYTRVNKFIKILYTITYGTICQIAYNLVADTNFKIRNTVRCTYIYIDGYSVIAYYYVISEIKIV